MIPDSKALCLRPARIGTVLTLPTLPAHILLHIIYFTFPQTSLPDAPRRVRQRKTLYWLAVSLRLVDRTLYAACMHVLRSLHIPEYDALVHRPYTSDPFPILVPPAQSRIGLQSPYASIPAYSSQISESPLSTVQRETAVLDKFIALKVREDVWADDSELHLERVEAYKDLFDHAQPRARLEDLVRTYGVQSGVICVGNPPPPSNNENTNASGSNATPGSTSPAPAPATTPTSSVSSLPLLPGRRISQKPSFGLRAFFQSKSKVPPRPSPPSPSPSHHSSSQHIQQPNHTHAKPQPIPISTLSITLAPRSAGLVLGQRTVVSAPRTRDEALENVARRLVSALQGWVEEGRS